MEAKIFLQTTRDNDSNFDCPPITKAQDGLNVLIKHFLGDDWYVVAPLCTEQVNTEAIYEILGKYPSKKDKKERIKRKLISLINKL